MSADPSSETPMAARQRRPPRPLPVFVLADISGSMHGEKIAVLNDSMRVMFSAFATEDSPRGQIHVAVVTFGGDEARLHMPLIPASQAEWSEVVAGGRTPLGDALDLTRQLIEDPEVVPESAFTPALVLVSDGAPTDDWEAPLDALLSEGRAAKAVRLAMGIGSDRTPEAEHVLTTFATPGWDVLRADQVDEIARSFRWVTAKVTSQFRQVTGRVAPRLQDLDAP